MALLPDWLSATVVGVCGLLFGSYLNVLIHRIPRRMGTVAERSRCPRCLVPIAAWQNIPVLSYVLLRGRCRRCRTVISWRYPAVELVTAGLFVAVWQSFDTPFERAWAAAFCTAILVLVVIDAEHFLLPDRITKPGIVVGLLVQPWLGWVSTRDAILGAIVGAGLIWGFDRLYFELRGVHGFGFGDVKMLAMIGAFLGWQGVIVTMVLASFGGSVIGLLLILRGRGGWQTRLPFGVFLGGAALYTLFFGARLLSELSWLSRL